MNTNVSLPANAARPACDMELDSGTAPVALAVAAGMPITPSPFKSWWKLVSSNSSAVLVPDIRRYIGDEVAAAVGIPDRILIGAGDLPGNLVAARRLLRADRRPGAELPRHNAAPPYFSSGPVPLLMLSRK